MIFQYEKDTQGIVTLTIDMPGRSANVLNEAFWDAYAATLDRLEAELDLTGVVVTSAKKLFVAGADIDTTFGHNEPQKYFDGSQEAKAQFRRLERLGKPVVAALNGTALGGGFELALSCTYRIALDHPRTKFGFPEVGLGLLPGAGGLTKTVRLLGLEKALDYLAKGTQVDPQTALADGLVDELASDRDDMMTKAHTWILVNPNALQPWDQKGYRIPDGTLSHPKIAQMLAIAPAVMRKETKGNYPAPHAIMAAMVEGAQVDFETACRIESRYFAKLAAGQIAKNLMIANWFHLNEIRKGGSRPKEIPPQQTEKVGVLGAGLMGHGIAYVTAFGGMDVVLKDVSTPKSEEGKAKIAAIMQSRVKRGRMAQEQMEGILERIQPTGDAADLAGCDLVIEAVFENRDLKARVTAEAEAVMRQDGVFASNTSTLPITGLAETAKRPERFIGLHFFSPVHRMKLVEIIVGAETSQATLAKGFDYVLQINKLPIVVNDSRGFYTSRVFSTWTNEGLAILSEGQHPQTIERAGIQAGMPIGPLALLDEPIAGFSRSCSPANKRRSCS